MKTSLLRLNSFFVVSFLILTMASMSFQFHAQMTIQTTMTPAQYVQNNFLGTGITASNIMYNGSLAAANVVQNNVSAFTEGTGVFQIPQGMLLTTGQGAIASGPNNLAGASNPTTPNVSGDADLNILAAGTVTNGVFLEFDFVANTNIISFDYIFGSEEYPEFAPPNSSAFNDVFGFLLSGPGIAGGMGFTNNAVNIAIIPVATQVSINNVNPATNAAYYADNTGGAAHGTTVQYDGTTIRLTATRTITCGVIYHIKMCICNVGDQAYDSGVFLESNSFSSNATIFAGLPSTVCGSAGVPIALSGSTGNVTGQIWSTSGTGTFSAPTSPTSTYTPSGADIVAGSVTLTFSGTNSCSGAAASSSTTITFTSPAVSVNPNPALICTGTSPNVLLTGTANVNSTARVLRTYTNSTSGSIPNNNAGGVSRVIAVSAITPTTLATNPIVNVRVNITHAKSRELQIRLISPSGQNFPLVNNSTGFLFATGTDFTNTVFTSVITDPTIGGAAPPFNGNFRPQTTLATWNAGSMNGNWTLQVIDAFGSFINNLPNNNNVGTLLNWSITFETDNYITSVAWTPPTNLTSTNTLITTASPPSTTTRTLTVTDALGCTNSVVVAITVAPCTLPIELTSFGASCENKEVKTNWTVASELNNDFFTVQRSRNGIDFEDIGTIYSIGNHTEDYSYSFTDENPILGDGSTGISYYRLKQTDDNGDTETFDALAVDWCGSLGDEQTITIFPNPVVDNNCKVLVTNQKNNPIALQLMDMNGKQVANYEFTPTSDTEQYNIDFPADTNRGVYFIRATGSDLEFFQKVIVQ